MVKFTIKAKDFKKFLGVISCKGTLQFKSKGKVEAFLFSAFFIDVDKENQQLSVLSIDNYFKAVKQLATIKANVKEAGIVEITDKKVFDVIFEAIDIEKPIQITSDDSAIYVENQEGDWYKRRIVGDKKLEEVYEKKDDLYDWVNQHMLVDIDGTEVWKFTVPDKGSALYPMRIETTQTNLSKFVKDTLKLTKDNSTVIRSEDNVITISTGQPNAANMAKHELHYKDIGIEMTNFAVRFSALQAIVPNLLEKVILNFRKTAGNTLVMRIESYDDNMRQVLSIASQDKDGVLYDDPEELENEEIKNTEKEIK
jgi:hypothetical protein